VAEPTSCAPSLAQLGNAWAEITICGRAAHAGTPERGHDAFRAAIRYITELEALLADAATDPAFPGHPRLNVGDFARYFAKAGTPAIVYGPGSLQQAHAPDEFGTSLPMSIPSSPPPWPGPGPPSPQPSSRICVPSWKPPTCPPAPPTISLSTAEPDHTSDGPSAHGWKVPGPGSRLARRLPVS